VPAKGTLREQMPTRKKPRHVDSADIHTQATPPNALYCIFYRTLGTCYPCFSCLGPVSLNGIPSPFLVWSGVSGLFRCLCFS
jgi:hypothetical protein